MVVRAPGKLCSGCKVYFEDGLAMWGFLKAMKGKKLESPNVVNPNGKLMHSIQKVGDELFISQMVSLAARELRAHVVSHGIST